MRLFEEMLCWISENIYKKYLEIVVWMEIETKFTYHILTGELFVFNLFVGNSCSLTTAHWNWSANIDCWGKCFLFNRCTLNEVFNISNLDFIMSLVILVSNRCYLIVALSDSTAYTFLELYIILLNNMSKLYFNIIYHGSLLFLPVIVMMPDFFTV